MTQLCCRASGAIRGRCINAVRLPANANMAELISSRLWIQIAILTWLIAHEAECRYHLDSFSASYQCYDHPLISLLIVCHQQFLCLISASSSVSAAGHIKAVVTFSLFCSNRDKLGLLAGAVCCQPQPHNTPSLVWFPPARPYQAAAHSCFCLLFSLIWTEWDYVVLNMRLLHRHTMWEGSFLNEVI